MPEPIKIAVYALTGQGYSLASRIARETGGVLFATPRLVRGTDVPFDSLADLVGGHFHGFDGHVFVAAAGIAVRCIAPHLRGKDADPAVVCLDQDGRFAVSLLSGHLGGANDLALRCAAISGGQAVITTATDCAGLPSLDMLARQRNMAIGNLGRVKAVNAALLRGEALQLHDPGGYLRTGNQSHFVAVDDPARWRSGEPGVWVSWRRDCPDEAALRLYPRVLMLGVGCRRGVGEAAISAHVRESLRAADLSFLSIGGLGSVGAKADEPGLLDAAAALGVVPEFFDARRLAAVNVPNPSTRVGQRMGTASVAEAAAILLARGGPLVMEKTRTDNVTLAVARSESC
ncbi:cobalamin biosynthesis protein CbiG [Pseudodesulfovibrio sp. F-1]|uniref:Cobalamin biosynthesis protein CbiG n=1 Tax=Pseudodesulfovibrio alkaliphilus TaxID=2661613 RepID=A0A7K1KNQ5_9BACT|nr:cobalamin biosynthesis protein [Pseudodesulfovibrio alkaliphilus]MUM77719.1 cobalamin biosynthesis protein CbiG [Pseudodesulfovibrio alkaliphilus]